MPYFGIPRPFLAAPGPVGNGTPSSGAFTTLSASGAVSGAGVTSLFASPPAIGGTTPGTGAFTTLNATGKITPSSTNGVVGTTAADSAVAGSIGEFVESLFASMSVTNNVNLNVASLSLTPGDWDVEGFCTFITTGTPTVPITGVAGISTTTATLPAIGRYSQSVAPAFNNTAVATSAPTTRINVSGTTTVYLVALALFNAGTMAASGIIRARRVR